MLQLEQTKVSRLGGLLERAKPVDEWVRLMGYFTAWWLDLIRDEAREVCAHGSGDAGQDVQGHLWVFLGMGTAQSG